MRDNKWAIVLAACLLMWAWVLAMIFIGNGTVAMKALLKYAKKINAKWIDGGLSSVDNDHADRRNHFYEKFGFFIKDSQIRLDL